MLMLGVRVEVGATTPIADCTLRAPISVALTAAADLALIPTPTPTLCITWTTANWRFCELMPCCGVNTSSLRTPSALHSI
mmetsp:Transcript_36943/g.92627  ORF Transcript_36943/g.92627 Transcript_36943/m.92627 type:complete len:80 (+) Transcript_36943:1051-1290(+)